jgi:hypothetical protein
MANLLPPIPNDQIGESHVWREWFYNLGRYIQVAQVGGSPWTVAQGGTGVSSITGYMKGLGSTISASASIPYTDISGGPVTGVFPIATKTTTYTFLNTDYTIRGDTTSAAFSVFLPAAPVHGQVFNIKKIDATVANALTLDGNGKNIDGAATKVITAQYAGYTVQYDSTSTTWNIL